ncbi:cysteine desulfurase family protein [Nocardioides iriomotensis]|uniref:Aminotransferase class V-fold PLP-dependent enzyme n=1 Tax=Nocardioides iriomotensis TaxID=715784 RepID=A0A4Q5IXA5_9ACTN|nr:aminotransferase class V-fold PLP-dependent enzyme [Nocardioides iriomotensis]RYU09591.1 aminotransferase class V-fold PLP-dependent enzyme [Nocardioides iriomotensis]
MTYPTGAAHGYLDSASAEPLHPAARETLLAALDQGYADPVRLHGAGRNARLLLDNAREVTASLLGARPDEVTFTSSATTAVHRGVLGLLQGRRRASDRLVHSAVEHSAVFKAAEWWSASGGTSDVVGVDSHGRVLLPEVEAALAQGAGVLAVQAANGEVGTVQPIAAVAELAAARDVPLFVDAAASAGRLPLPSGWAAASAGAAQWGGPAGVGVLLVRTGTRWRSPFPTDDRIDHRVAGFENVPGALAAAAALQAVVAEREETGARQRALVDRIRGRVAAEVPDVDIVGDPDDRLPHVVTFSSLYVEGEALVRELDKHGFAVSSGSACSASTLTPSHVLAAMGALTHGNVRVSLGRDTTEADVDAFLDVLPSAVAGLRP